MIETFSLGTIAAAIIALFGWVLKLSHDLANITGRTEEYCKQLPLLHSVHTEIAAIKNQQQLYDIIIKPHLANIIHSPEHTRRDHLVDKLVKDELDIDEAHELDIKLQELLNVEMDKNKKLAAALLLSRVRWIVINGGT